MNFQIQDMDESSKENNPKKTVLMYLCDKIKNCSNEAIKIMRTKPINSLKVITRNARNIKDPNPLQTMLMTLSTPYPLAIDKQRALRYNIPEDLLKTDDSRKQAEDSHYKGRILAKREALDWWIEKSPVPNSVGVEVINVLRTFSRNEVALYKSINWSGTKLQFGRCSLQRVRVPTRQTELKLSKEQREASIEQIFAPDSTIPYIEIPNTIMEVIKNLLKKHTHANMMLATQIRILANQMDPNYRFLLMQPGAGETTATLRHGLYQRTWEVTGISFDESAKSNEINNAIKSICDSFLDLAIRRVEDYEAAKLSLTSIKIFNIPLSTALREGSVPNIDSTKLVKSILEIPFPFEHQYSGVNFSPDDSKLVIINRKTGNLEYNLYMGREKVFFDYQDTRGFFVHNADSLYSMVLTFSTEEEVRKVFASVAVYCRIGLHNHGGCQSLSEAFEEIYANAFEKPWTLFPQIGQKAFWKILRNDNPERAKEFARYLTVREEVEYSKRWSGKMIVSLNPLTLKERGSNKTIMPKLPSNPPLIPPSVDVPESPFYAYLDPKRRLQSLVKLYMRNISQVRICISNKNFNYLNGCIHQLNQNYQAYKFSRLCRSVVETLNSREESESHDGMIALTYCFAGLHETANEEENECLDPFLFNWVEGITISLLGERGDFISSNEGLFLFGAPITKSRVERLMLYPGALPGFVIHPYRGEDLQIRSKQWLRENYENVKDGARFIVFIESEKAIVRKSLGAFSRLIDTVGRQCQERDRGKQKRVADQVIEHLARKRSRF
nr:MAG: PB2 [Bat faecal associated orthomyxo-like virus 1]